ncbi:MAG TPA: SBBP repeat-containing protein [Flavobacteriales bacterium]|nr:SBBP repeat-containing protein [Flavobacteriales bacterium]HPH83410.1 SBBP repeat-containing protein [Flavobacteriales bacterium]
MKKIKYTFLLLAIFSLSISVTSQTFQWAAQYGATLNSDGKAIATDSDGNVYTTGSFLGTADLNPGSGTFNLTSAGRDIFISKLDPTGNFIWAKKLGGSSIDDVYAIALDDAGNVYTTGTFSGTADFDPGTGTFNLTGGAQNYGVFISKLDPSGNFVWAKKIELTDGGNSFENTPSSIKVDAIGNVLIIGNFNIPADFDPDEGVFLLDPDITTSAISDIFILKLDASGNFVWAKQMGGTSFDYGNSISTDADGNVYTTGYFNATADFDPGVATFNFTSVSNDIFISKLDAAGNFVWAKQISGPGADRGTELTIDESGNCYVAGFFSGVTDFDPGIEVVNLTSAGLYDVFILKLDSSGDFLWAKNIGGAGYDEVYALAIDDSNNVYTTGIFNYSADFNPGSGVFNLTSADVEDIFISKLDSSGNFIGAKRIGGPDSQKANSLVLDNTGKICLTGYFLGGGTDFDPDEGEFIFTSNVNRTAFTLKLNDFSSSCSSSSNSIFQSSCGTYLFNNQLLTESGTYTDTLVNGAGCDSILTLNLTINAIDNTVVQDGNTLTANGSGTYQWVDCNSNFSAISGETNPSFTISSSGSFAVIVNNEGCIDTSACFLALGIIDFNHLQSVSVYPMPVSNMLTVEFSKKLTNASIVLIDLAGEKVFEGKQSNTSVIVLDISGLASGIYVLHVNSDQGNSTKKIVIQ